MVNSVLLVDDDVATNFIHVKFLKSSDKVKNVHSFEAGHEALDYLKEYKDFPEIIFVDINMPTMDAWEFLEEYRKIDREEKKSTKLALLTTSITPEEEARIKTYPEVSTLLFKPLDLAAFDSFLKEFFLQG